MYKSKSDDSDASPLPYDPTATMVIFSLCALSSSAGAKESRILCNFSTVN